MKRLIILSLLGFMCISSKAYEIKLKIKGCTNDTVYLGYVYAKSRYLTDTLILSKGSGTFAKDTTLGTGLYFIYNKKGIYFDMVIGKDQSFSIENEKKDLFKGLKVKGSYCSENFVKYRTLVVERNKLFQKDTAQTEQAIERRELLTNQIKEFEDELDKYTFIKSFVSACHDVELPTAKEGQKEMTDKQKYRFMKKHHFDNLNFRDSGLLRTEFIYDKIESYFSRLVVHKPDSICLEIDNLLNKTSINGDVFRFTLSRLFNKFSESKTMGDDAMVVHIAKNYYLKGQAPWVENSFIEKVWERSAYLEHNLLGLKAKDLLLETIEDRSLRLYDMHADYTVLIFWETDCGHCKKTIPKLYKLYEENKDSLNFNVMAVYTQTDKKKWQEFVDKHELYNWTNAYDKHRRTKFQLYYDVTSTPRIFILDADKRIVAKRVSVDQVTMIIKNENKLKAKRENVN